MKTCTRCKVEKPFDAYEAQPTPANPAHLRSSCRVCRTQVSLEHYHKRVRPNPERVAKVRARYKAGRRGWELKRLYGITKDEYDTMLAAQGGVCALCGKAQDHRTLDVDHDHATGKVRGLLCVQCNMGLGHFYDNPTVLRLAAKYVEDNR